jgi:hypothetical protein|nr:MAG TPA: hypothetical protein [Caudoviricetes sp.]
MRRNTSHMEKQHAAYTHSPGLSAHAQNTPITRNNTICGQYQPELPPPTIHNQQNIPTPYVGNTHPDYPHIHTGIHIPAMPCHAAYRIFPPCHAMPHITRGTLFPGYVNHVMPTHGLHLRQSLLPQRYGVTHNTISIRWRVRSRKACCAIHTAAWFTIRPSASACRKQHILVLHIARVYRDIPAIWPRLMMGFPPYIAGIHA